MLPLDGFTVGPSRMTESKLASDLAEAAAKHNEIALHGAT
jgi:hypothetical protein